MLLICGQTTRTRKLGWVSEFCRHCGEARAMRLRSRRLHVHLYYVAISRTGTLGHDLKCSACGRLQSADASRYPALARHADDNAARLSEHTNPLLNEALRMGLTGEELSASLELSDPAPASRLVDAVVTADTGLIRRGHHIDAPAWSSIAGCASALVLGLALLWGGAGPIALLGLLVFLAMLPVTIFVISREPSRYARRELEPRLVAFARSTGATPEDWDAAFNRLRLLDVYLERWLPRRRVEELREQLDADPPPTERAA